MFTGLLVLLAVYAADPVPVDQEQAWALLEGVIDGADPIRSLHAGFEQSKTTALLREPIVSSGIVRHIEGLTRWDTTAPYASTMVVTRGRLEMFYPDQKVLEVYELSDQVNAMATSPAPDIDELRKLFEISDVQSDEQVLNITFVPRDAQLAEVFRTVEMAVVRDRACLRQIGFTNPDDETTTILFSDVELNIELDRDELEMDVPEGTTVVHPLEETASDTGGRSD